MATTGGDKYSSKVYSAAKKLGYITGTTEETFSNRISSDDDYAKKVYDVLSKDKRVKMNKSLDDFKAAMRGETPAAAAPVETQQQAAPAQPAQQPQLSAEMQAKYPNGWNAQPVQDNNALSDIRSQYEEQHQPTPVQPQPAPNPYEGLSPEETLAGLNAAADNAAQWKAPSAPPLYQNTDFSKQAFDKGIQAAEDRRNVLYENYDKAKSGDKQALGAIYDVMVAPGFKRAQEEAETRAREYYEQNASRIPLPGAGGTDIGSQLFTIRNANIERDPQKVIDTTLAAFSDELASMGGSAEAASSEPMTEEQQQGYEQMMQYMYERMYNDYVQQGVPKGTAEYIARSVMENSITGQLIGMATRTLGQRQVSSQQMQNYSDKAKWYEKVGGEAAALAADLPLMGGVGKVSGLGLKLALKPVISSTAKKVAINGIARSSAEGIAQRALQGNGWRFALGAGQEALTFGGIEALGSAVGQQYQTGEINAGQVAKSYAKGLAMGIAMHGVRLGAGRINNGALRYGTSLAGRTAVFATGDLTSQWMSDPNFDIKNFDWLEAVSHAAFMNIGFDLMGGFREARQKPVDFSKVELSKDDISALNAHGVDGKNAREIAESLAALSGKQTDAKRLTASGFDDTGAQGASPSAQAILADPRLSYETKAKVAYLMTGKMPQDRLSVRVEVFEEDDGTWTVEEYDASGLLNRSRGYKTYEEADAEAVKRDNEAKQNITYILEQTLRNASKSENILSVMDAVCKTFGISHEEMSRIMTTREGLTDAELHIKKMVNDLYKEVEGRTGALDVNDIRKQVDADFPDERPIMKLLREKYADLTDAERAKVDAYNAEMAGRLQGEGRRVDEGRPVEDAEVEDVTAEEVDPAVAGATQVAQERVHADDGNVQPIVLVGGERVYLVGGRLATNQDGTINRGSSDNALFVVDESGNKRTIAPADVESAEQPIDAATYTAEAANTAQEQATPAQEAAPASGPRPVGTRVSVRQSDGTSLTGTVADVDRGNGVLVKYDQPLPNGDLYAYTTEDAMSDIAPERPAQQPAPEQPVQEQPISEQPTPEQPVQEQPVQQPTPEQPAQGTAKSRIPVAQNGTLLYEQATPEDTYDALGEDVGGDPDMVDALAKAQADAAEARLKALSKQPKLSGNMTEDMATLREWGDKQKAEKNSIAYWNSVLAVRKQREHAEALKRLEEQRQAEAAAAAERKARAEKAAAEAAQKQAELDQQAREEAEINGVPDWHQDPPEAARVRGWRRNETERVDRQGEDTLMVTGKEVQVKFSRDDTQQGTTALIEADQLQPSHIQGKANPKHFVPEAQPKDRREQVSAVSAQIIAKDVRPEEITSSITAYTGAPSVNSRGEVIQGNNRADALKWMWANEPAQALKYKEYLMEHAEEFGLTREQVEAMQRPILVNRLDVNDERMMQLGRYVASDTESGGIERIKPVVADKIGDEMEIFVDRLFANTGEQELSLQQALDLNGDRVIRWLVDKKYISDTQAASAYDKKGNLTAEAKNDLNGILQQFLFRGGEDGLKDAFDKLPKAIQNAILSTMWRDARSPKADSVLKEIQASIMAYAEAMADKNVREAKTPKQVKLRMFEWKRRTEFGTDGSTIAPAKRYSEFALTLAENYMTKTQNQMRNMLNALYDWVQGGVNDMFEPDAINPHTLAQAIKKVFDIDYVPGEMDKVHVVAAGPANKGAAKPAEPEKPAEKPAEKPEEPKKPEPPAPKVPEPKEPAEPEKPAKAETPAEKPAEPEQKAQEKPVEEAAPAKETPAEEQPKGPNSILDEAERIAKEAEEKGKKEEPKEENKSEGASQEEPKHEETDEERRKREREEEKERLYAELDKLLKGQLNSGIDPRVFLIGSRIAMLEIEDGAIKFRDFAKAVLKKLGDKVRPYIRKFYEAARTNFEDDDDPRAAQMDSREDVLKIYKEEFKDVPTEKEGARDKDNAGKDVTLPEGNNKPENDGNEQDLPSTSAGQHDVRGGEGERPDTDNAQPDKQDDSGGGSENAGQGGGSDEGRDGVGVSRGLQQPDDSAGGRGSAGNGDSGDDDTSGRVRSGSTAGSRGQRGGLGDGRGRTGRSDAEESAQRPGAVKPLEPEELHSGNDRIPYTPKSKAEGIGTVMPALQADQLRNSLDNEDFGGDIDKYVTDKLGYGSKEETYSHLSAEQIEGVALAIAQIERGGGFIIGDMTGVGKGRQGAAMIRYAVNKGLKPVYFTAKPQLFSDVYRDLADIGSGNLRPFIFASSAEGAITIPNDDGGRDVVYSIPSKDQRATMMDHLAKTGKLPDEYDFVLITYSQIQNGESQFTYDEGGNVVEGKRKGTSRGAAKSGQQNRDAIDFLTRGNVVVLDECHLAAGESNTGLFLQRCLSSAKGTLFMSATYAKRPDNMPLYSIGTGISEAGLSAEELTQAVEFGGLPLQEAMSQQLVRSGQMVRRERDFSGVQVDWLSTAEEKRDTQKQQYDNVSAILRQMQNVEAAFIRTAYSIAQKRTKSGESIERTPLSSILYPMFSQVTFALKADDMAEMAVKLLKEGKKPVIAYNYTGDSVSENISGIDINDDYGHALAAYMTSMLTFRIVNRDNKVIGKVDARDFLNEDDADLLDAFVSRMQKWVTGVPLSPVDRIASAIEKAGYKVGEISGRTTTYTSDASTGRLTRSARKKSSAGKTAALFNAGGYDALLINRSGSTGISIHSSEKFADQRPRVMISAQSQMDINDEVQMRGRIDRTGQVSRGSYIYLSSHIPAEQRIQMILRRKLKSLDANTTSSQKGKFSEGSDMPDILNKYGDEAVRNVLTRNESMRQSLGFPDDFAKWSGLAEKLLKSLPLMQTDLQEEALEEVVTEYNSILDRAVEEGSYDLELEAMPLDATVERRFLLSKGIRPGGDNMFADNAYIDECDVKQLRKPYSTAELKAAIERAAEKHKDAKAIASEMDALLKRRTEEYRKDQESKAEKAKQDYLRKAGDDSDLTMIQASTMARAAYKKAEESNNGKLEKLRKECGIIRDTIRQKNIAIGDMATVELVAGSGQRAKGVFLGYGLSKVFNPSTSYMVFAVPTSQRQVKIPFTEAARVGLLRTELTGNALEQWAQILKNAPDFNDRDKRFIATGNLLTCMSKLRKSKQKGRVISYTKSNGQVALGVLLPRSFDILKVGTQMKSMSEAYESIRKNTGKTQTVIQSTDKRTTIKTKFWNHHQYFTITSKKKAGEPVGWEHLIPTWYYSDLQIVSKHDTDSDASLSVKWSTWQADGVHRLIKSILKALDDAGVTAEAPQQLKTVQVEAEAQSAQETLEYIRSSVKSVIPVPEVVNLLHYLDSEGELSNVISAVAGALKKSGSEVVFLPKNNSIKGIYYADGRIEVDSKELHGEGTEALQTLLHELIHSVTVSALRGYYEKLAPALHITDCPTYAISLDRGRVKEVYAYLQPDPAVYGTTDMLEMVAELSNPEFRILLAQTPLWLEGRTIYKYPPSRDSAKATNALAVLEDILGRITKTYNPQIEQAISDMLRQNIIKSGSASIGASDFNKAESPFDIAKRIASAAEARKREQSAAAEAAVRTLKECGVPCELVSDKEMRRLAKSVGEENILADSNDVVYGAVVDGKVLLNADHFDANTPIHEYTHLWDKAVKRVNPELWKRGVELLKQTPLWEEVKNDPNYADLKSDDDIASEVHARLTGERGAEILEEMERDANTPKGLIAKVREWIKEYWQHLKSAFSKWTGKQLDDLSLDDFVNMTLKDFFKRVKPEEQGESIRARREEADYQREVREITERAKADGTFMKAPNGKPSNLDERQWAHVRSTRFKNWFGDWENDPENASRVVDENGEPKVVYHQTNASFNTFDISHARTSMEIPAFFFAPEYDAYHGYGDNTIAAFLNLRNPIENPPVPDRSIDDGGIAVRKMLVGLGHDGFARSEDNEGIVEYAVFSPNQIKSTTGNVGTYDTNNDDIRFAIGKKRKDDMRKGLLNKLTHASEEDVERTISEIEKLGEQSKAGGDAKVEKAALHWVQKGTIILPEDGPKVLQAVKMAADKGIDFTQYDNPMSLIDENTSWKKRADVADPDKVPTLSGKRTLGDTGITIYDVEDSEQGQRDMRTLWNGTWGKERECPWCLLHDDGHGGVSAHAKRYWRKYSKYPKRVAFKDGRPIAFFADDKEANWWDLSDSPHKGIILEENDIPTSVPDDILGLKNDGTFRGRIEYDEEGGISGIYNVHRGDKKNGLYEEYYNDLAEGGERRLAVKCTYKNGVKDGPFESYHTNGNSKEKSTYKDGQLDGPYKYFHENSNVSYECTYKNGKREGPFASFSSDGQLMAKSTYKNGVEDGLAVSYFDENHIRVKCAYKNGRLDGPFVSFYGDGQLQEKCTYKDGKLDGSYESRYKNGQLHEKCMYKDGVKDGPYESQHENGKPMKKCMYKDGVKDGPYKWYYDDGLLREKGTLKNDAKDGPCEEYYYASMRLYEKATYKNGIIDGLRVVFGPDGNVIRQVSGWYERGRKQRDLTPSEISEAERQWRESGTRFRTGEELDRQYPEWRDQTVPTGGHRTQRANTVSTYRKIGEWVKRELGDGATVLDASSGLGLGTQELRGQGLAVDDVEPYPDSSREAPTFAGYGDIDKQYDVVVSNAVLNVVPDDTRRELLHQMAGMVKPGGRIIINVRGAKEIESQKQKIELDSPSEILVTDKQGRARSYQKGFTQSELRKWVADELGDGWTVENADKNNSGLTGANAIVAVNGRTQGRRPAGTSVDAMQRSGGRNAREHAEQARKDIRQRAEDLSKSLGVEVTIEEDGSKYTGTKAGAKGWYDPVTGKITVVVGNHTSAEDMERTFMHETIAHRGLRKLLGDKFNQFLDNVYEGASEAIKEAIDALRDKNGYGQREATEEFLAGMAEQTNFSSRWGEFVAYVKQLFRNVTRKLGFKSSELTDGDLQYCLWASYRNQKSGKSWEGIFGKAERIAMRDKLKMNKPVSEQWTEQEIRYRKANHPARDGSARARYEHILKTGLYQSQEALQDSMLSLKTGLKEILKAEGKNTAIEDIPEWCNPFLGENSLASASREQSNRYRALLMDPLLDEVHRLAPDDSSYAVLTDYMMAKHGLERNAYMQAKADAEAQAAGKKAERRDWAGLTALTGEKDVQKAEDIANDMVADFEQAHDTTELWQRVNDATKAVLDKQLDGGLMSQQTYDDISAMYQYYIPLRGFDETTSAEEYAYLNRKDGPMSSMIRAKGRKSKADDPIVWIQGMAEGTITAANRNKLVKLPFLRFCQSHRSNLVSENDLYIAYDDVTDEWKQVPFPDMKDTDSGADIEQKMKAFRDRMEQLVEQEPDKYKRVGDNKNVPYRLVTKSDERQHQVVAYENGKPVVLTVNGSPRMAQAVNGYTNPDNDLSGAVGAIARNTQVLNRFLSAAYTSYNPDFMGRNFVRDMIYSNATVGLKESQGYAMRYHLNYVRTNPVTMHRLYTKYYNGTLGNSKMERAFREFMINGGETGYNAIKKLEEQRADVEAELKKRRGKAPVKTAWKWFWDGVETLNADAENCARFAAYYTSRSVGRSILRSIWDAKEISVNFNKKGAGSKFLGTNGQTVAGNTSAFVSGLGRALQVFWNAGVQGLYNFGKIVAKHPVRATMRLVAGQFMAGFVNAYINDLRDQNRDDDDKTSYFDIPKYTRRNNIVIRLDKSFLKIPGVIEFRVFSGLGDLAYCVLSGKEVYSDSELAFEIASQLSQALPLDMLEGGGGFMPFVPSVIKPVAEVVSNKDWTGLPISNKHEWNEQMPEWTKAYKNTNSQLVSASKWLSEATGGDAGTRGAIEINPAEVEALLEGYFGGMAGTIDKLVKSGETLAGARDYDPRSIPILNSFVTTGDERTRYRSLQDRYWKQREEADLTSQRERVYTREAKRGNKEYLMKLQELYQSPEYVRKAITSGYNTQMQAIKAIMDDESRSDDEREYAQEVYYNLMMQLLEETHPTEQPAEE